MNLTATPQTPPETPQPQLSAEPAPQPQAATQPAAAPETVVAPAAVPTVDVKDDEDYLSILLGLDDQPAAQPQQPQQQPQATKKITYQDLIQSPETFDSYMQQRDQELFSAATQHAIQQMIPVASQMVVRALSYQSAAERFWSKKENEVLAPYAQTFGKLVDNLTKKEPTLEPAALYDKAGRVLHAAIARQGGQPATATSPLPVPPTSTQRPNGQAKTDPATARLRSIFRWNDLPNK